MKMLEHRNLFSGSINEVIPSHCNTSLFWEGKKFTKC